jgi:glutaminyl-tRNA synthetase
MVHFGREIYIERDDFMEDPPKKFFRLSPGSEVRLRYAYFLRCREAIRDAAGEVVELRCTYDPETRGGNTPPDGRKVKATLHWVSAKTSLAAEVRLYGPLFRSPSPDVANFAADLDPASREILTGCRVEAALASLAPGEAVQFERQGYFCLDAAAAPSALVFNRTVALRDSFARAMAGQGR